MTRLVLAMKIEETLEKILATYPKTAAKLILALLLASGIAWPISSYLSYLSTFPLNIGQQLRIKQEVKELLDTLNILLKAKKSWVSVFHNGIHSFSSQFAFFEFRIYAQSITGNHQNLLPDTQSFSLTNDLYVDTCTLVKVEPRSKFHLLLLEQGINYIFICPLKTNMGLTDMTLNIGFSDKDHAPDFIETALQPLKQKLNILLR